MDEQILKIRGISKSFPGVKALDNVSFSIKKGRIHALMGENGAGKSTLIKILAGIYTSDAGQVELEGKLTKFKKPSDAQKSGISVVHQEIKLAETLTVTENIFLGNLMYTNGLVNWKDMRMKAKAMLKKMGMDLDCDSIVNTLSVAKKQMVEICKAINYDCKVLIMDEPSATLTEKELVILFSVMKNLITQGVTILYISHRMEEIFSLAQDITVLRDGCHIATIPIEECTRQNLIQMMVGRTIEREYPKVKVEIGQEVLHVTNLSRKGVFENVGFSLKQGEILGFSGLVGSGRTEVMRALLGIDRLTSGTITLHGKCQKFNTFRKAIQSGFGLIPEDRKLQGLVQKASMQDNVCMVAIRKVMKKGIVRVALMKQYALKYREKLAIATPSVETEVQYLSGGNQQKVVVSKWLMQGSDIIIMDEPTRGVDVGAKTEIYNIMCNLVKQGKSIIMISSEMPEVLGMCDRIIVMHEGKKVGELNAESSTQQDIMALCV